VKRVYFAPEFKDLHPPITRIDFHFGKFQTVVSVFADLGHETYYGNKSKDSFFYHSIYQNNEFNWNEKLEWLHANGYTVHEWNVEGDQHGARAWFGVQPWAIRTRRQIQNIRHRLKSHNLDPRWGNMDLAFDYIGSSYD
jgi:hypothetical protein